MAMPSSPATRVSEREKSSSATKHTPQKDELQALADLIDKSTALYSKYDQKRSSDSGNLQSGVVESASVSPRVQVGSIVNDLMLVAGEVGMYGLLFKLILLIKQRVDKVKEVDGKALVVKQRVDRITRCFDDMKAKFACSTSSSDEQKSILTLWQEEAAVLFVECAKVLQSINPKASGSQRAGCKFWIDKASRPFTRCLTSPVNLEDLDKCISKLKDFAEDMILEERARTVNNDLPYLGEKPAVGQRFCQSIRELKEFVSEAPARDNRSKIAVVHITGSPGAGKSRLAKEILHKIYSEQADRESGVNDFKLEFLLIDCSNSSGCYLEPVECQRKLIEQMADARAAEGLSLNEVGYTKIQKVLREWKDPSPIPLSGGHKRRKVVMFFDNAPTHISVLNDILPDDISKLLPSGSCVIVSMRGCDCDWKKSGIYKQIQRLFPTPTCRHRIHEVKRLECMDSRILFEQYAGVPPDTNENSSWDDIIHDLIERCEGNPKLLIHFSKFFPSQSRTQAFWKDILKKMEEMDNPGALSDEVLDGLWQEHTSRASNEQKKMLARFTSKLGLWYRMKAGECEEPLSDICNLFDGWNWNMVEAIFGKGVLRKLRDQNFISSKIVFDNFNKDLHDGNHHVGSSFDVPALMNQSGHRSSVQLKVVQANQELRDTARKIYGDKHLQSVNELPKELSELGNGVSKNLRSLCLVDCKGKFQLRWLDKMQGLHHLILHNIQGMEGLTLRPQRDLCYLHWGSISKVAFPFEARNLPNLQTLVLTDFDFKTQPKMEILPTLQNLILIRCQNLHLVAETIFNSSFLKSLHLQECDCEFSLSDPLQTMGSNPLSMSFQKCASMERIPAFVLKLRRLTDLGFISCPNLKGQELEWVPNLKQKPSVTTSLKTVSFEDCRSLTCVPKELARYVQSLTELEFRSCQIQRINPEIAQFQNLRKLTLASCPALETLPQELGELSNLQKLFLEENRGLKTLPREIGKLQFLKELWLDYSSSLQSLPVEIEDLKHLSVFSMSFSSIHNPKTETSKLPDLGKLQDLRYVNLACLEPRIVRQKLADSTISISRGAADEPCILIKDLPTRDRRLNPFSSEGPPGTRSKNVSRTFTSANN